MDIPAFLPLNETLAVLSAESGRTWTRSAFFGFVVDHGLPVRAATPEKARPIIPAGGQYVDANLPYRGRRLAVLSTAQTKDLWLFGEAKTRSVALEPGEAGYLDWESLKARRAVLNRSTRPPVSTEAGLSGSDWFDGEFMGECEVSLFSEVVRVTDDTCLVPRETIEELLAVVICATLPNAMATRPAQVDHPKTATPQTAKVAQEAVAASTDISVIPSAKAARAPAPPDATTALATLFDPVTPAALERMFPAGGKWAEWTERAGRNGLKDAREGRAVFNPYRAALWFLQRGEQGWDLARCHHVLAKNLPARSRGEDYKLTGLLD